MSETADEQNEHAKAVAAHSVRVGIQELLRRGGDRELADEVGQPAARRLIERELRHE